MTDQPTPSSAPSGLGREASAALGWSVLNTAVGRLGTLAINVALARVLGPGEFGAYAVALVAMMAVLSFNELGVSLAIVRWEGKPDRIAPTVMTISVGLSALLAVVVWVVAPTFADAMGSPATTPVVRVMGLAVLLDGLSATPAALLQRTFRQRERMVVDQVNTWLGAIVSLALALLGAGAMSLAAGRIAGALASWGLLVRASPLPYRFGYDRHVARELVAFGLPLAASSVVFFAASYADQIIVGALLGPGVLALYVLAFNLASWPVSVFSQPLRSVAPSVFARMQSDPARMNHALVRIIGMLLAVVVVPCVLLSAVASPIVEVVYGSAWSGAASALRWLGLAAVGRIAFELCYDFLVVTRSSVAVLVAQLVGITALGPALVVGSWSGLSGVSAAQVVVTVGVMVPVYAVILRRRGVSLTTLGKGAAMPLAMGAALWVACGQIVPRAPGPWWSLAWCGLVGACAFAILIARRWPQVLALRRGSLG